MTETATRPPKGPSEQRRPATRELRVGLVLYGGVSLAVYMHGVTKELHKVVLASRAVQLALGQDGGGANPFDEHETEYTYFELLASMAAAGTSLNVTIDIIAGTSAGGINGVVLAKALANYQTQAPVRDLWLKHGDIAELARAPRLIPTGKGKFLAAVADSLLHADSSTSVLHGDKMSRWIYDALAAMDAAPALGARISDDAPSLVPAGQSLDLRVTATDLTGYERTVESGAGSVAQHDRTYRHVFAFRHDGTWLAGSTLDPSHTDALAFAARATSSFPGAFRPVSIDSFAADLGPDRAFDGDRLATEMFQEYTAAHDDPRRAWLIDGGVLANAPFGEVIGLIASRSAETEVIRRLVFLEPDPAEKVLAPAAAVPGPTPPEPDAEPSFFSTVAKARTSIPWHQPLLADLLKLRDMNERVREVGAIAGGLMSRVQALLDRAADGWSTPFTFEELRSAGGTLHQLARDETRLGYGPYVQLKLLDAAHAAAQELTDFIDYPPDSSQASFVRAVFDVWIRRTPEWASAIAEQTSGAGPSSDATDAAGAAATGDVESLLARLDLPYRRRRLQFVLQGINSLYGAPRAVERTALDAAKKQVFTGLDALGQQVSTALRSLPANSYAFLGPQALGGQVAYGDPEAFVADPKNAAKIRALIGEYATALETAAMGGQPPSAVLWQEFNRLTAGWGEEERRELLARYVGFPLWDAVVFPVIALSQLPQLTPIGVARFSPREPGVLGTPEGGKLKGAHLAHFAAFFDRSWRENDYVWGRLDGVEQVLRLVVRAVHGADAEPDLALLQRAFDAVLASEGDLHETAAVADYVAAHRAGGQPGA
jgi:patatin-related protein